MKRKYFPIALAAAFLAFYFDVGFTYSAEAKKKKAPEFSLKSFDNKEIKLSDFQGKPVVLKFMASW